MADSWNAISCDPTAGSSSNHPPGHRSGGVAMTTAPPLHNLRLEENGDPERMEVSGLQCGLSLPEGVIAV